MLSAVQESNPDVNLDWPPWRELLSTTKRLMPLGSLGKTHAHSPIVSTHIIVGALLVRFEMRVEREATQKPSSVASETPQNIGENSHRNDSQVGIPIPLCRRRCVYTVVVHLSELSTPNRSEAAAP